jgi:hypothetical protein
MVPYGSTFRPNEVTVPIASFLYRPCPLNHLSALFTDHLKPLAYQTSESKVKIVETGVTSIESQIV